MGSDSMFGDENIVTIIIKRTAVLGLIIIGIMLIGIKEPKPYILGYIFGTSISILTFKLMEKSAEKAVTMKPSRAYGYSVRQYFIRYFIYAIVLIIGALADYLSFLTVATGLLMVKMVITSFAIIDYFKDKFQ
jgi:hypothetical protein